MCGLCVLCGLCSCTCTRCAEASPIYTHRASVIVTLSLRTFCLTQTLAFLNSATLEGLSSLSAMSVNGTVWRRANVPPAQRTCTVWRGPTCRQHRGPALMQCWSLVAGTSVLCHTVPILHASGTSTLRHIRTQRSLCVVCPAECLAAACLAAVSVVISGCVCVLVQSSWWRVNRTCRTSVHDTTERQSWSLERRTTRHR